MIYGDEVKRLRVAAGLSQKELAEKVGVSQGAISQLEQGQRTDGGTVSLLFALCRALGVGCDHFEPFFPSDAGTPPPTKPAAEKATRKPAKRKGRR